jgi:choice-of-anchor A domain-containing protein
VPSLFNTFVFEDFICYHSDTEGRLAAGGNVEIENYAVGCRVRPPPPGAGCIAFGSATCANASSNGEWLDNLVVDGDLYARNLELKLGNIAVGGTHNGDLSVNFQEDCTIHDGHPIRFDEWKIYLQTLSSQLCSMPATGMST